MTKINTVVDKESFMSAMKCWPSGVVVVTTNYNGTLYGFSACSFVGVSLDPALVSFSKDNYAASIKNYLESEYFGVSILCENQIEVLKTFGSKIPNKFDNHEYILGEKTKSPLIVGASCHFECKKVGAHQAGDHTIIVGQVLSIDNNNVKNNMKSFLYNYS